MIKKKYVKPHIIFEDFSLNVGIAGDCESDPVGNPTRGACAVIGSGNIYMFSGTVAQCEYASTDYGSSDPDKWDGFCYHIPTEDNTLFNS